DPGSIVVADRRTRRAQEDDERHGEHPRILKGIECWPRRPEKRGIHDEPFPKCSAAGWWPIYVITATEICPSLPAGAQELGDGSPSIFAAGLVPGGILLPAVVPPGPQVNGLPAK